MQRRACTEIAWQTCRTQTERGLSPPRRCTTCKRYVRSSLAPGVRRGAGGAPRPRACVRIDARTAARARSQVKSALF